MIKELLGIVYSYLNWASDQKYLVLFSNTEYIKKIWEKHTLFEIKSFNNYRFENYYTEWSVNRVLHRDNDKPAGEYKSGTKMWYKNGKCHRGRDLPAVEWFNGNKEWYRNGKYKKECKNILNAQ